MRGETRNDIYSNGTRRFQSTLLMRGETIAHACFSFILHISIHSPHARRDPGAALPGQSVWISIHSPHARRDPQFIPMMTSFILFQSTLLMRGETYSFLFKFHPFRNFNPLSSCEERHTLQAFPCLS